MAVHCTQILYSKVEVVLLQIIAISMRRDRSIFRKQIIKIHDVPRKKQ